MTEKKHAGGRPSYEPTDKDRAQIRTMSGMGIPDYDIAKVMNLSTPTIRKYFWTELESGHIEANAKVAQSLFKQATDPSGQKSVTAAIFWLKCRAGWREEDSRDNPGKKEQQATLAQNAEDGTTWDGLLQ
jgi:hypothetical protein